MVVTSIEPLNKYKSKVFLDENFAFVLYKGELKKYQITEEKEITEEIFCEIINIVLVKRAKERALFILNSTDKTEAELRRKLKDNFYPETVIDCAIEYVKQYNYINDERYTKNFVERMKKKKSKKQIICDLKRKGIEKEIAEQFFCDEDQQDVEEKQILSFLERKRYNHQGFSEKDRGKLINSLMRKGYSYDRIRNIMRNYVEND